MDSKSDLKNESQNRLAVLSQLIREGKASNQEDLAKALKQKKFHVTQSTISRDLRRIGAVKTFTSDGDIIYKLPDDPTILPPTVSHALGNMLIDIQYNESMIVLHTTPGSASLVARHFDSMRASLGILGTIAGDDTIFIAPASVKGMATLIKKIKEEF